MEEPRNINKRQMINNGRQRVFNNIEIHFFKAKVALLKKACKEKDERLEKMKEETQELKHSIATSAIDDLSKIQSFGFSSPENFLKFGGGLNTTNHNTTQVKNGFIYHFTSLHFTSLHFTSLHFTSLHFTSLH